MGKRGKVIMAIVAVVVGAVVVTNFNNVFNEKEVKVTVENLEKVEKEKKKEHENKKKKFNVQTIGDYDVWIELIENYELSLEDGYGNHEESFIAHLKVERTGTETGDTEYQEKYEFIVAASQPGQVYGESSPYISPLISDGYDEDEEYSGFGGLEEGEVRYYPLTYVVPRDSERLVLRVRSSGDEEYMYENLEFDIHNSKWEEFSGNEDEPPINLDDIGD